MRRAAVSIAVLAAALILSCAGPAPTPAAPGGAPASPAPAGDLATPAEICRYRCTPPYAETLDYIRRLQEASPLVRLSFFGESCEGYRIPLVVAARKERFSPEQARASGLPIVLIVNGIHAGEIDGKDASLALLRDIVTGKRDDLLDRMVLLVVPIYNVDGHERVSPDNRLAQNGPVEGMGFRANGRGLDLNRDFTKMEAPETAALVGRLFREWRPHLVLDNHVTDGIDFQYEMTYFAGEGLNAPAPLLRYVSRVMEAIGKGLAATGHKAARWGDLIDDADPNQGAELWAGQPRYSTGYFEARNRVSLLSETHAYKPFDLRVAATFEMIRAILDHVAADPASLLTAVSDSEAAAARRPTEGFRLTLDAERSKESRPIDYEGWAFRVLTSEVTGERRVIWDTRSPATWRIPLFARFVPTLQAKVARGYLLSRAYAPIAEKAFLHGLRVERTTREAEIDAEVFRVSSMKWEDGSYQGHHEATAEGSYTVEKRAIPPGTYWIPLDQPDAAIAVWLLEPESPDGLLHWNFFDNVLEQKKIVEDHVAERIAADALEDPNVRAEYQRALAADPMMRENSKRRLLWFYRRSRFNDSEVGVYPAFRVTGELGVPTEPWSPVTSPRP